MLFRFFSVDIHRWNNDDDDDGGNDRKTDLGRQSNTSEEDNRQRKSRWNGKERSVIFTMIRMIFFLASTVKQEPMDHQFVQQIHEGE